MSARIKPWTTAHGHEEPRPKNTTQSHKMRSPQNRRSWYLDFCYILVSLACNVRPLGIHCPPSCSTDPRVPEMIRSGKQLTQHETIILSVGPTWWLLRSTIPLLALNAQQWQFNLAKKRIWVCIASILHRRFARFRRCATLPNLW